MQEENKDRKERRTRARVTVHSVAALRCKVIRCKSRVILPGLRGLTHSICAGVSRYFLNIRRRSGARRRHFSVAVNSVLLLIVRHSRYRSPSFRKRYPRRTMGDLNDSFTHNVTILIRVRNTYQMINKVITPSVYLFKFQRGNATLFHLLQNSQIWHKYCVEVREVESRLLIHFYIFQKFLRNEKGCNLARNIICVLFYIPHLHFS